MLFPHRDARFVTVSDEADPSPNHFTGVLLGPAPAEGSDEKVWVGWWCTSAENGFGKPVGPQLDQFKHLGDNAYGA